TVKPGPCTWSLHSRQLQSFAIEDAQLGVYYRSEKGGRHFWGPEGELQLVSRETTGSIHGPLSQARFVAGPDANGLNYAVVFAIPEDLPFLLIKASVINGGAHPVNIERIELMQAGFQERYSPGRKSNLPGGKIHLSSTPGDLAFFSNGWQSWNFTGAYGIEDRFRRTRLGPFASPMRVNLGTPHPRRRGHFSSDMFGVLGDRKHRSAILAGFLSQEEQFGTLVASIDPAAPSLRLWANGDHARLDPGSELDTDWACISFFHLDSPDPMAPYLDAVARQNGVVGVVSSSAARNPHNEEIPAGWCSWYYYYQRVTAQDIRQNLDIASNLRNDLPLKLIQIDDGFESQVGDWYSFSPAFPDGVAPLAQEIAARGFTPGLWLAPFIVHPKSRLAHDHPDWLLRNRQGKPVNAGYIWDVFDTALDLTHPEAVQYAADVVHTAAHEWNFPFLKLDFLYAAALPGQYRDPTRTRAQVLRAGLKTLREAAGEQVFLLGCGCPLGPAIGLVDAMRIGCDVDSRWRPAFKGVETFFQAEPDMPSARNAIQNVLTRAPLHRRWWINDPDCLLVRPASGQPGSSLLTLAEVQSLATVIALSGGVLLLSDNLAALPPERLQIAKALLPVIGKSPWVLDWFDSLTPSRLRLDLDGPAGDWHVIALFNWSDHLEDLPLRLADFNLDPQADYFIRSFWNGELYRLPCASGESAAAALKFREVPAHGVVLLALRKASHSLPQYLGSSLHISQGLELVSWAYEKKANGEPAERVSFVELELATPGKGVGEIDISLPCVPHSALINGSEASWLTALDGCYRFTVEFDRHARIQIGLKPGAL
ncbi:MAG: alpha-galactosidase, partial [Chloroflexota bacterium]